MKAFEISKPPDNALIHITKFLIEKKGYGGAFALTKKNTGEYAYALITNADNLDSIVPTFPLMPANAGKLVSQLTVIEAVKKPVAVILRPCELRALYELVKLEQARLENLLFISFTCSGVYKLTTKCNGLENKLAGYWEKARTGDSLPGIRETCALCVDFVPENADIILSLAGNDSSQKTIVLTKSSGGETALQGLDAPVSDGNLASTDIEMVRCKRTDQKGRTSSALKTEEYGWEGLSKIFGRCINCHACSRVCPICYCKLCYIDSAEQDRLPLFWEMELSQKESLRIPADAVMYHLVRLLHVSVMCVGCGMCSDICPVNIPVASIFTKVSDRIQEEMDYEPGKDLNQKIPLVVINS
jgi:formate dehydrogenase subunit beta